MLGGYDKNRAGEGGITLPLDYTNGCMTGIDLMFDPLFLGSGPNRTQNVRGCLMPDSVLLATVRRPQYNFLRNHLDILERAFHLNPPSPQSPAFLMHQPPEWYVSHPRNVVR